MVRWLLILLTNNGTRSQASPIFLVLSFAFSKIPQKQKNGEDLEHLSHDEDTRWMYGGNAQLQILCAINLRVSFLPVKSSTRYLTNVWALSNGALVMEVQYFIWIWTSLLYVRLAFTWRHSHDKYSQVFPIFNCSSSSVCYTDLNQKTLLGK